MQETAYFIGFSGDFDQNHGIKRRNTAQRMKNVKPAFPGG
jgi:hypothetical protein